MYCEIIYFLEKNNDLCMLHFYADQVPGLSATLQ
jgi:hypothetical protein